LANLFYLCAGIPATIVLEQALPAVSAEHFMQLNRLSGTSFTSTRMLFEGSDSHASRLGSPGCTIYRVKFKS